MRLISPTDEDAKKLVKRFCDQVHWLRDVRRIYKELFENEDSPLLMERTAPSFFSYLNTILHRYLLLEFAKIIDPAETYNKENFTVANLLVSIHWPNDIRHNLELLIEKTNDFRKHIKPARDKLLAHTDKKAFLEEWRLGEFPEGEDEVFLTALQEVCDLTHKACFGSIYGVMLPTVRGDVINLKRALLYSIAFKDLLSESSGQEMIKLNSYLEKATHRPTSTGDEARKEHP